MKKIITLVILSATLFAQSTHNNTEITNENQEIIYPINQGISMSCNINIDFLNDITIIYQDSIDISTIYLDKYSNKLLKEIAQKTIDTQNNEIKSFQDLIDELNKEKKDCDSAKYKEIQEKKQIAIEDTIKEMHDTKVTNNIDIDFSNIMVSNGKNLIKNAEIILEYTENNRIKEIAKGIIQKQNDLIRQIQKERK